MLMAAAASTDVEHNTTMPRDSGSIEDLMSARATAMALVAQAYAARPAETRYGPRPSRPRPLTCAWLLSLASIRMPRART